MADDPKTQVDQDLMEIESALYLAGRNGGSFNREAAADALKSLAEAAGSDYCRDGKLMFTLND